MPYFYLYDTYLGDRSYANQLIKLETTLTDLGLQGRIARLTILKSVRDLVEGAIREGADTIVAVGNDATLSKVAEVLARHTKTTLGFIPLGQTEQHMAELLGVPTGTLACHVLSGRLVERVSLGQVNKQYFIQSITCSGTPFMECELDGGAYRLELTTPHTLKICNLAWHPQNQLATNPPNNTLELILKPKARSGWFGSHERSRSTVLPIHTLRLTSNEELPLVVDGYRVLKTPATVNLARERLRMIVGKKRLI